MKCLSLKQRLIPVAAMAAGILGLSGASVDAADLKEAAPPGAFMAIYGKHNPERDYQKQYYADVWQTAKDSRIFERSLQILQSNIGEADAQKFVEIKDALTSALAPIEWEKLGNISEVMYAQQMVAPTSQHVVMMRVPDGGAASLLAAGTNLFNLAAEASQGQVPVQKKTIGGVEMTTLALPEQVPFQPMMGVKDDIFIFTTSGALAEESLKLLANPSAVSKFDDPRVKEALSNLPAAEDSMVFFDAKTFVSQLNGFGDFIRNVSNGNEGAERAAGMMTQFFGQMDAIDFELTVEYTDGFKNRSASYGKLREGAADTVLGKMLINQQPFENWSNWVPATASGYSLSSGATLHPLYQWLMTVIPETFPEAQQGLDQFAAIQDQLDFHVDADLLQAFGGEVASLTFPGKTPSPLGQSSESVFFARCNEPERMKELIHRGMNALNEIPQVKGQGLGLKEAAGLEGFEELTANMLGMMGVRPVIGFRDGWMIVGTHKSAVEQALLARSGEAPTIVTTDGFKNFDLEVGDTVYGISYTNNAEATRQMAAGLQQAGMMLPMLIGMAGGQNQGGPNLQVLQDIAGLLPSIGKIVAKFDFIESTLSTTVAGPTEGTWIRNSVTLIRPPAPPAAAESQSTPKAVPAPKPAAKAVEIKIEADAPAKKK